MLPRNGSLQLNNETIYFTEYVCSSDDFDAALRLGEAYQCLQRYS